MKTGEHSRSLRKNWSTNTAGMATNRKGGRRGRGQYGRKKEAGSRKTFRDGKTAAERQAGCRRTICFDCCKGIHNHGYLERQKGNRTDGRNNGNFQDYRWIELLG